MTRRDVAKPLHNGVAAFGRKPPFEKGEMNAALCRDAARGKGAFGRGRKENWVGQGWAAKIKFGDEEGVDVRQGSYCLLNSTAHILKHMKKKHQKSKMSPASYVDRLFDTSLDKLWDAATTDDPALADNLIRELASTMHWLCIRPVASPTQTQLEVGRCLSCCENLTPAQIRQALIKGTMRDGPHPSDSAAVMVKYFTQTFGLDCFLVEATDSEKKRWFDEAS